MAVLGVDPGVNGGMALLRGNGVVVHLRPIRDTMKEGEVVEAVRFAAKLLKAEASRHCFIEIVGHMTGDGGKGSHTFGYIKGLLRGCLLSRDLVLHNVYPQVWQGAMGCMTGGNKNISKAKAIELFPWEKVTHNVADALLIAEYGRRRLTA